MRPRRRLQDPEVARQRMAVNAELVALSSHPSWPAMQAEVGHRRGQIEHRILTLALAPGGVDQRQIDFLRGVLSGIEWLVGVPDNAERSLEKALAEQQVQLHEEDAA